ncbi:hypothetical protein Gotri_001876 [Gossypium trilobum]|uniref:Uncharacterized protein n=1 Tax=Gossypium trilobum TaxID=34281 RepID=A0A7J9FGH2_9ROSI|nr:hypothetical protein [Gossypium trilobum]
MNVEALKMLNKNNKLRIEWVDLSTIIVLFSHLPGLDPVGALRKIEVKAVCVTPLTRDRCRNRARGIT